MQKFGFCILFFSVTLDEWGFFVYNVEKLKERGKKQ
jgi:hypothetical protein